MRRWTDILTGQASGSVAQRKQVMNIIWVAMTAAVGVYWYVHSVAGVREPNASVAFMVTILAAIAFVEGIGAWVFHRVTLANISQQVSRAQLTQLSVETASVLEQRLQTTAIICLAMFEAIVVYGLVGSFVGSPYPNTFEWFAGVGLVNLVIYRFKAYPAIFGLLEQLEKIPYGR